MLVYLYTHHIRKLRIQAPREWLRQFVDPFLLLKLTVNGRNDVDSMRLPDLPLPRWDLFSPLHLSSRDQTQTLGELTTAIDSSEAMPEDQENSQHVRSINNVVQGVDQTPDDPKYGTFLQHRYFSGVPTAELHLNRIQRELLDPETPAPLPKPPSKAPIVVEGVDQTPDDPNWTTFYEYHYNKDGVREADPHYVKKPREDVDVEVKFTATMKVPGAPTRKLASTTTRQVVRKIALNPDHPQFASLSNKNTYDIIETTKFSIPAAYAVFWYHRITSEIHNPDNFKSSNEISNILTTNSCAINQAQNGTQQEEHGLQER